MVIEFRNPATGKRIRKFEEWDSARVDAALARSWNAFQSWRHQAPSVRADLSRKAGEVLRSGAEEYASLITQEMGKPISESRGEVLKCAWVCEHYADRAADYLEPEIVETDAGRSYVAFEPLGPVLAVMPWNFPFWQVFRFAAPALTAGNTGLLKHASNVPSCALAIEEVFRRAGYPENVFRTLLIGAGKVESILDAPAVRAVTLTGSENAGRKVARKAGERLKKAVLELGGSDPFVVLEDADLDKAAKAAASARCQNNGQSCIAAKRFIVLEEVFDRFVDLFRKEMEALTVGDPMDESTRVGPLARPEFLEELHSQVKKSVGAGASLIMGGEKLDRPGWFYRPTILVDVKPGMPVYEEEVFGPVAAVIRARDESDARRIANDTAFGLGASVWTSDPVRGERFASGVEAGAVFVNGPVKSDPRLPFGGVKNSGYGRELGRFGIREFTNIKTVWIK